MSEDIDVAYEAREIARQVAAQLTERERSHDQRYIALQQLHDERHVALQSSIQEIKTMLSWVGGVLITLIISVLGWSLAQQYNANMAQQKALQDQIVALKDEVTD